MFYLKYNANGDPEKYKKIIDDVCNTLNYTVIIMTSLQDIINNVLIEAYNRDIAVLAQLVNDMYNSNTRNARLTAKVEGAMMSMFGDELNRESLFNTLSVEDFNPTSLMDLGLPGDREDEFDNSVMEMNLLMDHMVKMNAINASKYGLALEAKYLKAMDYDKILYIHEAIGEKIKSGFEKFIEALKRIGEKFIEAVIANVGPEKAWLEKYKNTIMGNTVDPNTDVTLYCNIDPALNGELAGVKIPAISYEEIRRKIANTSDNDTAKDEDEYFKSQFPNLYNNCQNRSYRHWADEACDEDSKRIDLLKYHLGAKYPNGLTNKYYKKFSQLNIKKMYEYLIATEKLARDTRDQIKAMERTVNNYIESAKAKTIAKEKEEEKQKKEAERQAANQAKQQGEGSTASTTSQTSGTPSTQQTANKSPFNTFLFESMVY